MQPATCQWLLKCHKQLDYIPHHHHLVCSEQGHCSGEELIINWYKHRVCVWDDYVHLKSRLTMDRKDHIHKYYKHVCNADQRV